MRRRLLEIGYTFSLLRYAIWGAGLLYLLLHVFVCITGLYNYGTINRRAIETATEFAVFITPAFCAAQGAIYFGNALGRMRIEWRQDSLARQLVDVFIVTLVTYLAAAILFRILSLATISLLPREAYPNNYRYWQDKSIIYFSLHALFALALALEIFFAAVFFGSSFRHPVLALAYQGVTLFALSKAHDFVYDSRHLTATDIASELLITGLVLLVALPMLVVIPVLLTAIQRASDGWRASLVATAPLLLATVCFSLSMGWLHHRSLTMLRSVATAEPIGDSPNDHMYRLVAKVDETALNDQALADGFNRAGRGSEDNPGINLYNNRGDVVRLSPDGSMTLLSEAPDHPYASPLSGAYPLTGKDLPLAVAGTNEGHWLLGTDWEYGSHYYLRFLSVHGPHEIALPNVPSRGQYRSIDWGLRTYRQGVLVAFRPDTPNDTDAAAGSPLFLYYRSPHESPTSVAPANIRELSALNGLKVKIDNQMAPHLLTWTDSSGQHDCPLPGRLKRQYELKVFASVLHGEPFLWVSNTDFTTQVPNTFCHKGGVFAADMSVDQVRLVDDNLIVSGPARLWLIRTFAQPPEDVPLSTYDRNGTLSIYQNTPLRVDGTTLWYSDVETALRTVDVVSGISKLLHEPRFKSYYYLRRDGVFIQEHLEWSYVPWHGKAKHFGLLFPPLAH